MVLTLNSNFTWRGDPFRFVVFDAPLWYCVNAEQSNPRWWWNGGRSDTFQRYLEGGKDSLDDGLNGTTGRYLGSKNQENGIF